MQLILGAGKHQRIPGAWHVDQFNFLGINQVIDLNLTPWPLSSDSYTHVSCIHLVEHLDSLVAFMNESHRVLKKGGTLYCVTPHAGKNTELEWADPTHKRLYTKFTVINYFTLEGVEKWGYTDKAWAILKIDCVEEGEHKDCLEFLVTPLK